MTQLEFAKKNIVTALMRRISSFEGLDPRFIVKGIKEGKIVILLNKLHRIKKPCAVGSGVRTKINANIGTSTDKVRIDDEIKKLKAAQKYGADTVMDLSVGGNLGEIHNRIRAVFLRCI